MSTIPTITEQDIRTLVGERSFPLGQSYFRDKAIFNAQRQGMTLKAHCHGSQPEAYHMQVTFDTKGITNATCTCPIGGYCKHVAALLLTWLHQPENFLEQQEVDTVLSRLSNTELIALIKKMLQRQPDFESLLPLTISKQQMSVNPVIYQHKVETAFRRGGYGWGAAARVADNLLDIKETADEFTEQQDYANAIAIYEVIITGVIENYDQYEDDEGELGSVIDECIGELDRCLDGVQDDIDLRENIMEILFAVYQFDIEAGGIGIGDEAPDIMVKHTTAEERHSIAGWVRDILSEEKKEGDTGWRRGQFGSFLLDLEKDTLDDEAFLRICRKFGRTYDLVDRLLTLGRIDEATRETEQVADYSLIGIADLFVQHGHDSLAERMIQERSKKSQDTHLLEWLKQRHLARNDQAAALELAEELFQTRPSPSGYQEIRGISEQLGRWETLRSELLDFLEKAQNTSLLIHIALDEGEIDKALALLKSHKKPDYIYGCSSYSLELTVAKAAEETRPRAAIELYQKEVERLIAQRGRDSYQTACGFLKTMRALYEKLDESEVWTRYITALRERNSNLRALKDELAKAGLYIKER